MKRMHSWRVTESFEKKVSLVLNKGVNELLSLLAVKWFGFEERIDELLELLLDKGKSLELVCITTRS